MTDSSHDYRMWIGVIFLVGYYVLAFTLLFVPVPEKNGDLVNNMLLTLGPPVGMIVGALFRTDKVDEKRADTSNKIADMAKTAAETASTIATSNASTAPAGTQDDPVHVAGAAANEPPVRTTTGRDKP